VSQYPERPHGGFHRTAVGRPVGLFVIFVTLLVIGVIAYRSIPLQMLPGGLSGTRLSLWVNHPGSGAQENEEKVARVIEEQLRTLPDLEHVWSRSSEGNVRLWLSFAGSPDMHLAKAELRDRIERARPELPDTVGRIFIWANDDGDLPVMWFAILDEAGDKRNNALIDTVLKRRLEAVDGVSRVEIMGLLDDSVRILLDEDKVKAARLDIGNLIRRLATDNFAQPLGKVNDGGREFLLRSDMRFRSLEDIRDYPLGDGLRIRDIARVERVETVRNRLSRIDGKTSFYGMIQKESTANVVEVAHRVEDVIASFDDDPQLAGKISIEVLFSQATFIENSLARLRATALWGGGLASLVLLLFLRRIRMTICVALSIPVSALLAITWESFTGGTFNILTMTGLTLGIGMLVDNSVVVVESIARQRAMGQDRMTAAVNGVRDVGLAISLATLTSVVVFLPLIFMGDNPRMHVMLSALGIPLCASLIFSLLVALIFLPAMSARITGDRGPTMKRVAAALTPVTQVPTRLLARAIGLVRAVSYYAMVAAFRGLRALAVVFAPLRWTLAAALLALVAWRLREMLAFDALGERFRALGIPSGSPDNLRLWIGLGAALAVIAAGLLVVALPRARRRPALPPRRPTRFTPVGGSLLVWLQSANHALLEWTLRHRILATLISGLCAFSIVIPLRGMTLTGFGEDEDLSELEVDIRMESNFTLAETSAEIAKYEAFFEGYREEFGYEHLVARFSARGGEVSMRWAERQDPEVLASYRRRLRRELPRYAGHEVRFSREQQVNAASRQYVTFQIRGPSAEALDRYGREAVELLETVPGLLDVSTSLDASPDQVRLVLDSDSAFRYGVTSDAALQNVSWALRGANLPRYQEEGREVPFLIEYDSERLAGLDTLRDLEVYTAEGVVPMSAFAEIRFEKGRRSIFRSDGQTTFSIQARVDNPNRQGELVESGYTALEALDLPRGFSLGRDTSVRVQQQEEMNALMNAMGLSVVLVFLLMGILFESLLLPISVLTTIPFAAAGALWTLYFTGTTMDSVGWIGVIILVGVVVNNGIVLIDKIHRMRLAGMDRTQAVLEGAEARVRPILMTAMTTVFGLLPMALGDAAREAIDYRALATCVAGGLAISTFFTLWVVPLAYTMMDDLAAKLGWVVRRSLSAGPLPRAERSSAGVTAAVVTRSSEPS